VPELLGRPQLLPARSPHHDGLHADRARHLADPGLRNVQLPRHDLL